MSVKSNTRVKRKKVRSWWVLKDYPTYELNRVTNGFKVERKAWCSRNVEDRYGDDKTWITDQFVFATWKKTSKWLEKDMGSHEKGSNYKESCYVFVKEEKNV